MLIFISYPGNNLDLAEKVAAVCRDFGHEPFIAPHAENQLCGGGGFLPGLCAMIERCDAFILCVTQDSLRGHFQKLEWNHAIIHGKETPFVIYQGHCDIPEFARVFSFSESFQWCRWDDASGRKQVGAYLASRSDRLPDEERFQWCQKMVVEAGLFLTARYGGGALSGPPVLLDDRKNCATNFDHEIQKYILQSLEQNYPGEAVLAEEDIEKGHPQWTGDPRAEWIWTVDAIDGTLNFLAGDDRYCCAIGLLHWGEPYMGALFLPAEMLLISGGVNRPAAMRSLRDGSVQTLRTDQDMKVLDQCWTLTHINSTAGEIDHCFVDNLPKRLHQSVRRVWMWGCGLIALSAVARGTHHLFVQRVIWPWDIVPGLAIVHAAGGLSTAWPTPEPQPWRFTGKLQSDVIVACNADILTAATKALATKP